jgi:hypothetical protein
MDSRSKIKDYIFVYLLTIPIICRWLFTETLEDFFTISFFYYPLFIPEILFLFLPFYYVRTSKIRKNKLVFLSILGLFFLFLGLYVNDCNSIYLNFIGGTDFYITTFIIASFPLEKKHLKIIKWPIFFSLILLSFEVVLYSTIWSYSGLEDAKTYGGIKRISTTAGGATGTSVILFTLSSIAFYLFYDRRYIKFLILVVSTLSILFTLSRSAIVAQLFFLLYYFFSNLKLNKSIFKYLFKIFLFVVISILLNKKYQIVSSVSERIVNSVDSGDYTSGRFERFDKAYSLFLNEPIFGNGSSYLLPYNRATSIKDYSVDSLNSYSPHNFFLLILVDYGLYGFLLIILILFEFVKISFQDKKLNILNFSFYIVILIFMNLEIVFINMDYLMPTYLMASISRYKTNI